LFFISEILPAITIKKLKAGQTTNLTAKLKQKKSCTVLNNLFPFFLSSLAVLKSGLKTIYSFIEWKL